MLMCAGQLEAITRDGWIPKRPKGPDCKSGGTAFAGSNPAPPNRLPLVESCCLLTRSVEREGDRGVENGSETSQHHPENRKPGRPKHESYDLPISPASLSATRWGPASGGCNSMVEYLPSKQATWVRFPSPALGSRGRESGPDPHKI